MRRGSSSSTSSPRASSEEGCLGRERQRQDAEGQRLGLAVPIVAALMLAAAGAAFRVSPLRLVLREPR